MTTEASIIDRRVNIGPGARKKRTAESPMLDLPHPMELGVDAGLVALTKVQADFFWTNHIQEGYEVAAVVSDMIVTEAISRMKAIPPFGGSMILSDPRNLHDLQNTINENLRQAGQRVKNHVDNKKSFRMHDSETSNYDRYQMFKAFAGKYITDNPHFPVLSVGAGINAATGFMGRTLENILEIYKRQFPGRPISIRDFREIAHNSWPYVAQSGSQHLLFFETTPQAIDNELDLGENGLVLKYKDNAKERIKRTAHEAIVATRFDHPAFGCPAMVNFGDGSPIRQLWDLNIELAEKIYQIHYRGQSVFRLSYPQEAA